MHHAGPGQPESASSLERGIHDNRGHTLTRSTDGASSIKGFSASQRPPMPLCEGSLRPRPASVVPRLAHPIGARRKFRRHIRTPGVREAPDCHPSQNLVPEKWHYQDNPREPRSPKGSSCETVNSAADPRWPPRFAAAKRQTGVRTSRRGSGTRRRPEPRGAARTIGRPDGSHCPGLGRAVTLPVESPASGTFPLKPEGTRRRDCPAIDEHGGTVFRWLSPPWP